ncbi:hypothetical protein STANM309S_01022 [Streptomyces tanashiensis]
MRAIRSSFIPEASMCSAARCCSESPSPPASAVASFPYGVAVCQQCSYRLRYGRTRALPRARIAPSPGSSGRIGTSANCWSAMIRFIGTTGASRISTPSSARCPRNFSICGSVASWRP